MQSCTTIDSEKHYMTFDRKAGDRSESIVCICLFWCTKEFLEDILSSKIVILLPNSLYGFSKKGVSESCSFVLVPQFGYTNQKLEDVLCNLFEKYNL